MERFGLEDPCTCSHTRAEHAILNGRDLLDGITSVPKVHCSGCYWALRYADGIEICKCFKLDNLKYLEMLSKEKEVADL